MRNTGIVYHILTDDREKSAKSKAFQAEILHLFLHEGKAHSTEELKKNGKHEFIFRNSHRVSNEIKKSVTGRLFPYSIVF